MIETLLDILQRSQRSCSVAEVVSGRPTETGPTSCMAGRFYAKIGERWPSNEHGLMLPLIQIVIEQLPTVPACLRDFSLLTMFLDRTNLPADASAANGDGWLLRLYRLEESLVPLQSPTDLWTGHFPENRGHFAFDKQFPPRLTRLSWRRSESDYPGWEDYGSLLPHSDWNFDELHPKYCDIAKHEYGTKVGGWPTYIQGGGSEGEFAFQVASHEKSRILIGDNGNIYIFKTAEGWDMLWDCY